MPSSPNVPSNYPNYPIPMPNFSLSLGGGSGRPNDEILRHAPSSSLETVSATLRPDPYLVLQDIDAKLTAVRARFDANWQEWQSLHVQKQDVLAQQSAPTFSICGTDNLLPSTITSHTLAPPQPILSSPMISVQPQSQSRPTYTIYNRAGSKIFRCQCGHETPRKGDMIRHHKSLVHAGRKSQTCSCGKRYTRKDSLRRHQMKCICR